jgi:hypothetical protein
MPISITPDMVSAYIETYREFSSVDRPTARFLERLMEVIYPMIEKQETAPYDHDMDDQMAMTLVEGN